MPRLQLSSFDDVLAALDGQHLRLPPSAGRGLAHCAQGIECSLRGYPRKKPAIFRATVGKLAKRVFLRRGWMRHDTAADLPGCEPVGQDVTIDAGLRRLRAAIAAFRTYEGPLEPHFAYGACDRAEYERIHAMHIADHLQADIAP
jgi:hypothetical protein